MEIASEELTAEITLVRLSGTLDIAGADSIDLPLSVLANSRKSLLIDLAGVDFLASMGIRSLLTAARVVGRRGGRLVLLNPVPVVEKVLTSAGVDSVMPIAHGQQAALAVLTPA